MDDRGGLHVTPELKERLERFYGNKVDVTTELVKLGDRLDISDEAVAIALAGMNRQARLVFRSERRRGASEAEALEVAREVLPR